MKMSEKSYQMLTDFYNHTVNNAGDNEVNFIMKAILRAAQLKTTNFTEENFNVENPALDPHNAKVIKDFVLDFLRNASDDDAIFLIEGIKALCKEAIVNKKAVMEFVSEKKLEALNKIKKAN